MWCDVLSRGYWALDRRTLAQDQVTAVSQHLMGISTHTWQRLNGFLIDEMVGEFADIDVCLRAREIGLLIIASGQVLGTSTRSLLPPYHSDRADAYTADKYSQVNSDSKTHHALHALSDRWGRVLGSIREERYITQGRAAWVMHCGGSQGLEAATILQHLTRYWHNKML
jgi:hypothetical protein